LHSAAHRERRRLDQRIRATIGRDRRVRRRAHDHLQRRVASRQRARGSDEGVEVARNLLGAASREERQHRPLGVQPEGATSLCPIGQLACAIEQRVSHEGRVHAVVAQELLLERQDHRGAGHRAGERGHPAGA
jgi:hypothetical protein